jgi:hypothetical protein
MNVAQPLFNPPNTSNWQPNDRLLVHFDLDGSILGFLFRLDNMVCTPLDGGGKHCQFGVNGTPVVIPIPVVIQSPRTNQTDDFYPIQVQGATYGPIVQASPDVLSTAAYNSDRGDPVGKIGIVFVGPMVVVTSPLPTSSGCGGAGHPCQAPK